MKDKQRRRCKAHSPMTDKRCVKDRSHIDTDKTITHQNGSVTWGDRRGHAASRIVFDELSAFNGDKIAGKIADAFRVSSGMLTNRMNVDIRPNAAVDPGMVTSAFQTLLNADEPQPMPTAAEVELANWWRDKAEAEIGQTVSKAIEYGSTDLIDIGHSLARVAGRTVGDGQAAEWGIFFYLEGKLSRWRSAMERGVPVSDDTLLDIGVYARMAQRIRATGGWPGTDKDPFHSMCTEPCSPECEV